MSNGKATFLEISNKDVWDELQNFRLENNRKHEEIIGMLAEFRHKNDLEHSSMSGRIKLAYGVSAGVLTVVVGVAVWIWEHIRF